MKIKTLILVIMMYALVFGGFYSYLKLSQLEKPLFLSHYYQKEIINSSVDYIPIHYITNQGEDWQLTNVTSEELPGHLIFVDHEDIRHQEGIFQHNEAYIRIKNIEQDEVILKEMTFTFSNGKVVEADIGAIHLKTSERKRSGEQVVQISAAGSSNQGESYSSLNIIRDSELTDINLEFKEALSPVLKLGWDTSSEAVNPEALEIKDIKSRGDKQKLTDIDLPIKLNADDSLRINAVVDKDLMYENDIHAIEADITGMFKTDQGEIKQNLIRISEQPYLTSKQIKELKKLREEENKDGKGN
ncbi:hypothetical protein [Bacillus sp. SG-1]|uniref:hypothetical protein n=1 Tax=Bacillus sp. SG-1 TaxID=161544 RepID=UPI0001545334|nr:hypothetical protein [Bacillus sp. SG-1]EDL62991.1 hypothetical protein BSG1_06032 [Bacillus sp. SG-1]